jgi:hypothetical protein
MDKKNILFQIPATITKLSSMAHKSWRIQIDTQENMKSNEIEKLAELQERLGWMTFVCREKNSQIKPEDLVDLPELSEFEDAKKSPSKRLRGALWVYYKKSGGKPEDFEVWYLRRMEKYIQEVKDKIPQD